MAPAPWSLPDRSLVSLAASSLGSKDGDAGRFITPLQGYFSTNLSVCPVTERNNSIVCSSLRSSTSFNRLGNGSELPFRSHRTVRERGVEPPRPYRALAPEASASAIPPLARFCTAPRDYHGWDDAPKMPQPPACSERRVQENAKA